MKQPLIYRIRWSSLFPIICIAFAFVLRAHMDPLKYAPQGGYGRPATSDEYPDLDFGIWQVMDDGDRVYVLFSSHSRIIQVYNMEGIYEKTLFFQRQSNNGKFFIATEEGTLYVKDEAGNVYVFYDGEYIRFVRKSEAAKTFSHINFRIMDSSGSYIVKGRSVWRVSEPNNVCIIEGKAELTRFAELSLAVLSGLVCICITRYLERHGI